MSPHAQLTVQEIRGPYMQLLTNLQGQEGRFWLVALNRFLRGQNPWVIQKVDGQINVRSVIAALEGVKLKPSTQVYLQAFISRRKRAAPVEGPVVELSLLFRSDEGRVTFQRRVDFEEVLEWFELPNLSEDKRLWERFRERYSGDAADNLTEAYFSVALREFLRMLKWDLEAEEGGDGPRLIIVLQPSTRRGQLSASIALSEITQFLELDSTHFGIDED